MHRRDFLATGALGLVATCGTARGMGRSSEVGIALLKHGSGYDARPTAVEQLMWEVSKRTSVDVRERPGLVSPDDPELFEWPFLAWLGDGPCEPFSDAQVKRLRRFLRSGGFLFVDDLAADDRFDESARRELARIWPDARLGPIDDDHTLYRTFFLFGGKGQSPPVRAYGRTARVERLEGVHFDDRSPILYGRNDLFGAFGRDDLGSWHLPVVPGGGRQRELAFRLGINLLMYATCLNYKRDQVHTVEIMRRRRWKVSRPPATR